MDEYRKVDVAKYFEEELAKGTLKLRPAKKVAKIHARRGNIGETVISWSVDENGNEVKERENTVKVDSITNNPGWVVTKIDKEGNPIIDKNNHYNQWIVSDYEFNNKYVVSNDNPNIFVPKNAEQLFVDVNENLIIIDNGKEMKIAKGGYLNVTKPNSIYGISQRDFNDTYEFIEEQDKEMKM